jgi:purine-binding chemotaxis protein CheW
MLIIRIGTGIGCAFPCLSFLVRYVEINVEKQLVIFELGNESFGIEIANVESIIKMQVITRMPRSLPYVEGIINLRGVVIPVIDLEKRFGLLAHERNHETRIVIVSLCDKKLGLIVTAVSEVLTVDDSVIASAPTIVTTINSAFIDGIARIDSRLVVLLNLNQILTRDELSV